MIKLPNITIKHLDGQLGRTAPSEDGISGLVLSGTATTEMALYQPKPIYSVTDLTALGITESNNPLALREVTQFYSKAQTNTLLWVMLIAESMELTTAVTTHVNKLLDAAEGKVRLLGMNRLIPDEYEGTNTAGIYADVLSAKTALHALALNYRDAHKPFRSLLPHLGASAATFTTLKDLREDETGTVAIVSWLPENPVSEDAVAPAIGHTLGKLSALPVNQNLGRVKNGEEGVANPAIFDLAPEKLIDNEAKWELLHSKGYIFLRKHFGKVGWYFNDDTAAAPVTSDYSSLSRGRTIDKAHRITYKTMAEEILDDIEIDDDGKIPAAMTAYYQSKVEQAIAGEMNGEISGRPVAFVDPNQDVLATDKLNMSVRIRPRGQVKYINIDLSFDNPNNN